MLAAANVALSGGTIKEKPSVSHGTTSDGWLENGKPLPTSGPNFKTYSWLGSSIGRTYVHSSVRATVLDAYSSIHGSHPEYVYVFGETGWESGGRIKPHKTHQNGLSVDFMVPVKGADGTPTYLPCNAFNKYGYDIEFDKSGVYDGMTIDFESMAVHLLELERAASDNGLAMDRVIFDPNLQPLLFAAPSGKKLKDRMRFSTKPSWVRHDEHYHVDFTVQK